MIQKRLLSYLLLVASDGSGLGSVCVYVHVRVNSDSVGAIHTRADAPSIAK